jgi:hypothetical protein
MRQVRDCVGTGRIWIITLRSLRWDAIRGQGCGQWSGIELLSLHSCCSTRAVGIRTLLSAALFWGSINIPLIAQEDTAHHRAVYKTINDREATFKKVKISYKDEGETFTVTAWLDGREVRKIVAESDDKRRTVNEYYLEGEKPLFVFSTFIKSDEDKGTKRSRIEEHFYFRDGTIFKWLTTDKKAPVYHAQDYRAMTESYNHQVPMFLVPIKSRAAGAE